MADFINAPITDCHVHLRGVQKIPNLMMLLDDCRISRVGLVCTAGTPQRGLAGNSVAMLCKAMHPQRVFVFGGLEYGLDGEPTKQGLRRQAEALRAAGCDGMKMIEGKPTARKRIGLALDGPVYDEYYAYLEAEAIPILYHVADPETFWDPGTIPPAAKQHGWDYTSGDFPTKEQLYAEIDGVLGKFPKLRIIFAHFYFLSADVERAARFMDAWPNVSFDITPGSEMYRNFAKAPQRWREFFTRYQDRILFGTDNGPTSQPRDENHKRMAEKVWMMRMFLETAEDFEGFCTATSRLVTGIGLDREVLEKIYHRNYLRYTSERPRPLDLWLAQEHCRRLVNYASANSQDPELLSELKQTQQQLRAVAQP